MELILLQKINKLGTIGDVVTVKSGFARNYLLPSGKALRATKENIAIFEKDKEKLIAKNNEEKSNAEKIKEKLSKLNTSIVRSASDTGILYGSVTTRDIAKTVNEEERLVDRKDIVLDKPIKELGVYDVKVNIHPEVEIFVKLKVVRNLNEATEKEELEVDLKESETNELNIDENLFEDGAIPSTEESEIEVSEEEKISEDEDEDNKSSQN